MPDKRMTEDEVVGELDSAMTIGIGGWGSRRTPMSLVRAILRSDLTDLHLVSYGGPDVGILCAAGKVRKVTYGFVSLDSIPLEPVRFGISQETRRSPRHAVLLHRTLLTTALIAVLGCFLLPGIVAIRGLGVSGLQVTIGLVLPTRLGAFHARQRTVGR